MAARKKAAKASKATKSKPISKPSSVTKKNTSAKISEPPTRRSNRILMKSKRHEVRLLENGLVDMSETPPWLNDVVERNANQSPLLRLPGEIRNKIYHYAMTGNVVMVDEDEDRTLVDEKTWEIVERFYKGHAVDVKDEYDSSEWLGSVPRDNPAIESAFHLPEVCRQIYTDTATLAYSETIFYLDAGFDTTEDFKLWSSTLLPAQRNAITDIAMEEIELVYYLLDRRRLSFRGILPGLKRLHLCKHDLDLLRFTCSLDRDKLTVRFNVVGTFEEWVQDAVHQIEKADVEVVFHSGHEADDSSSD